MKTAFYHFHTRQRFTSAERMQMNIEYLFCRSYVIKYSIYFNLTKRCVNTQLQPAGMNENHYEHQTLGSMLKLRFELMRIHLHWFYHAMTGHIKIQVLCNMFLKIAMWAFRKASNGCLALKEKWFPQTKKPEFIEGLFVPMTFVFAFCNIIV